MENPVVHWRAEHANFLRLLDILDKQLAQFHSGGQPNYELMVDIVSYLRHFPDLHHHPREDAAFAILANRDPAVEPVLARLKQEHRVIAAAGEDLLRVLRDVQSGSLVERAAVEAVGAMYLVYYSHHIGFEEREILPLADLLLDAKDWASVALARPAARDPLFGEESDAGYRELRRHILLEAAPD